MKRRKLKPTKFPPNLQEYIDTFGHPPSREAQKFKSMEELDNLAEYALRRGKPIRSWENRKNVKTGTLLDAYYPAPERSENKPKSKDRGSEPQRNPLGPAQSHSIPNTSLFDSLFWRVKRDFEEFSISKSDELEGVWWWPVICLCVGAGVGYAWYSDSSNLGAGIGGFFMVYGGLISGSANDSLEAFVEHFIGTGAALLLLWVFDFQLIAALVSCLIIVFVSGIVTLRVMADSIRQSRYKL